MAINMIKLAPSTEKELSIWLDETIGDIEDRIEARASDWKKWREQYEGKTVAKDFPWKGASNVHVPLTAIMVDAIHANMMNRLFGFERLWDVFAEHSAEIVGIDSLTGDQLTWADLAKEVQNYLKWESGDNGPMRVYDAVETGLLECIKLGTVVWFAPWETIVRDQYVLRDDGSIDKGQPIVDFDGPALKTIPLEDFLMVPYYSEIHGPHASPLVGHKELLRPGQVAQKVYDGHMRKSMKDALGLGIGYYDEGDEVKSHQARLEGEYDDVEQVREDDVRIYKLWLEVDINGDDREESVYVEYHRDSGTIARIQPYIYPTRPYNAAQYVKREHRFYGIGVPEMLESIQRGINTNLNQSIDNATIANVRGFAVRRRSAAAKSLNDWYPGKKILFDQESDIKDFQLGEVYPSTFEVGRVLQALGERRVGIGDPNLGREVPGNMQGTATTTLALLQESSKRFDLYSKDIRRALSEVGMQVLERIQQFKPVDRMYAVLGERGELVERTLTLPTSISLREHLRVNTTSSASSANKEVARQNSLTAFGTLSQYFERLLTLAGIAESPEASPAMRSLAKKMAMVGDKLMQKVLEGFDLPEIGTFLPQLEGSGDGQNMVAGLGGPQPPAQPVPQPGVAGDGGDPNAPAPAGAPTVPGDLRVGDGTGTPGGGFGI